MSVISLMPLRLALCQPLGSQPCLFFQASVLLVLILLLGLL